MGQFTGIIGCNDRHQGVQIRHTNRTLQVIFPEIAISPIVVIILIKTGSILAAHEDLNRPNGLLPVA